MKKASVLLSLMVFSAVAVAAQKQPVLSMESYLEQVRSRNQGYQGYSGQREGALGRARESSVVFGPSFFANAQAMQDAKLPMLPLFTYRRIDNQAYSLGVSQMTSFGLQAKLAYELSYTAYLDANLGPGAAGIPLAFYDARPVIELSQSLWQNGFGRSTRASQDLLDAQAKADEFGAEAGRRATLLQAESSYWRLVSARETARIQLRALAQSEAIYDYVARRAKMNLGERGDVLQAEASLKARRLEVEVSQDEERSASRTFNILRGVDSKEVTEPLAPLDWEGLERLKVPSSHAARADVLAAEARARLSTANSRIQGEKDKPVLDVFGTYAMNGRDGTASGAFSDSYSAGRPTRALGVRFSMPLNVGAASDARRGALLQEEAADRIYQQQVIEQERDWQDLIEKLENARERLRLAGAIESVQKQKIEYERSRLKQGRTTTFQVLMFEQDYAQAALARTRVAAEVLSLLAQLKLYAGSSL